MGFRYELKYVRRPRCVGTRTTPMWSGRAWSSTRTACSTRRSRRTGKCSPFYTLSATDSVREKSVSAKHSFWTMQWANMWLVIANSGQVDYDFGHSTVDRFCSGWWEFGRIGWATGKDGGTSKSKSTQPWSATLCHPEHFFILKISRHGHGSPHQQGLPEAHQALQGAG